MRRKKDLFFANDERTAEILREYYRLDDKIVYSNLKYYRQYISDEEKKAYNEWCKKHDEDLPSSCKWLLSLDTPLSNDSENDGNELGSIVFERENPEKKIIEMIYEFIEELPEKKQIIFNHIFISNRRAKELAEMFRVSESYISIEKKNIINYLRSRFAELGYSVAA